MTTRSPYDVLGVVALADEAEIRSAYVELARVHHPDAPGGSHQRMQEINEAWALLSDAGRRGEFDAASARQLQHPGERGAWTSAPDDDLSFAEEQGSGSPVVGVAKGVITFAPICFLVGLVIFVLGVVLQVAEVVQGGLIVLLLSLVTFLMAPFLAMGASIQRGSVAESAPAGAEAEDESDSEEM